jgi:hypothetical protein
MRLELKLVCVIITDTSLVILTILCSQNGCGEVVSGNITLVTMVTIITVLTKVPMETKVPQLPQNNETFDKEDIHKCTYLRKKPFVFT